MNRFYTWIILLICWTAAATPGLGQSLSGLIPEPAPQVAITEQKILEPPASMVIDENGFFDRNPDALKRISEKFQNLEREYGYRIYLSVQTAIIGTSLGELSAELQQVWIPDNNGMVVVFETNSRSVGISRNPSGPGDFAKEPELLPTHASSAAISRAVQATDPELATDIYIESFVETLVADCTAYFQRRNQLQPSGHTLRIWLYGTGGLMLLGLAALAVGWLIRQTERRFARKTFSFPPVASFERLGAPSGAGVTARPFGQQRPKRP